MKTAQLRFRFPNVKRAPAVPGPSVGIDDFFPEEESNRLAHIESYNKHLFRPNTYLHKWWARRSGTTFRYMLKQLVPQDEARDYYAPGGLEGMTILDPMMGGGTTLHEAIRLGANVLGYDIDPIPVLQVRATLSDLSLKEKESMFAYFLKGLENKLCRYFRTTCPLCENHSQTQFVLYGVRKHKGNDEVIVVDSFVLRVEGDGQERNLKEFYPDGIVAIGRRKRTIMDRSEARGCGINGKSADLHQVPYPERYVPLVIVGNCLEHGSFMKGFDQGDMRTLQLARRCLARMCQSMSEHFLIPAGPKSDDLLGRGIRSFTEVFSCRQLIYLYEAKRLLQAIPDTHRLWIALLVSTSMEFNSMLCGYKGAEKRRPGAIRHVFSHHAYSFPYTALENNPVFPIATSGTLRRIFNDRILRAGQWARMPIERRPASSRWEKVAIHGESDIGHEVSSIAEFAGRTKRFLVAQMDSSRIPIGDCSVDFVVTDPPYFDSVQYSDLSHFFRCWLSWYLPDAANWHYLTSSSAVAESNLAEGKFGTVLARIWKECSRVLARPHGRLIFTYHHWRASAWAQLSIALARARFQLENVYTVHSENPISVHIRHLRALKHDSILVLRPSDAPGSRLWQRPEICHIEDSRAFCKACGQILGWVLQSNLDNARIVDIWNEHLGGA